MQSNRSITTNFRTISILQEVLGSILHVFLNATVVDQSAMMLKVYSWGYMVFHNVCTYKWLTEVCTSRMRDKLKIPWLFIEGVFPPDCV